MQGDVSFTFLDRIEEVELNIVDRRWQSALALALTLPDICGGIAFPEIVKHYRDGRVMLDRQKNPTRDVGTQYIRWFDEYAGDYFKLSQSDEKPYICGERCWQLRCEYLHQNKGFLNDENNIRFHLGLNCGMSVCQLESMNIQEKTQCAVFKGTDRAVFLDKREFTGPIYTQIEEAVDFVLRNIRLGATIDGLVRKEKYELPPEAIREMIINAHCHRNLLDESCIQVAVYDDRLEVTSPGGLYNGLTYEEVMNGHSKIRNKGIANIFSQMGLVEAWGSGIKRILNAAEEYGLLKPRFQEFDNMFRVELFRNSFPMTNEKENIRETSEKHRRSIGEASEVVWRTDLNDTQQKIIKLLSEDHQLSAVKLAEKIGVASRNIENNIKKLKEYGILIRHGSPKNGYWEIVDKDLQE